MNSFSGEADSCLSCDIKEPQVIYKVFHSLFKTVVAIPSVTVNQEVTTLSSVGRVPTESLLSSFGPGQTF